MSPRFPRLQNYSACAARALDVIIVTKERISSPGNSVVTSTELKDSEHGKDKEENDNKGNNDGDSSDSADEDDDIDINNQNNQNNQTKGGALELKRKAAFFRGKGMKKGMQHLVGWKVGNAWPDVDFFGGSNSNGYRLSFSAADGKQIPFQVFAVMSRINGYGLMIPRSSLI